MLWCVSIIRILCLRRICRFAGVFLFSISMVMIFWFRRLHKYSSTVGLSTLTIHSNTRTYQMHNGLLNHSISLKPSSRSMLCITVHSNLRAYTLDFCTHRAKSSVSSSLISDASSFIMYCPSRDDAHHARICPFQRRHHLRCQSPCMPWCCTRMVYTGACAGWCGVGCQTICICMYLNLPNLCFTITTLDFTSDISSPPASNNDPRYLVRKVSRIFCHFISHLPMSPVAIALASLGMWEHVLSEWKWQGRCATYFSFWSTYHRYA